MTYTCLSLRSFSDTMLYIIMTNWKVMAQKMNVVALVAWRGGEGGREGGREGREGDTHSLYCSSEDEGQKWHYFHRRFYLTDSQLNVCGQISLSLSLSHLVGLH